MEKVQVLGSPLAFEIQSLSCGCWWCDSEVSAALGPREPQHVEEDGYSTRTESDQRVEGGGAAGEGRLKVCLGLRN